MDFKELEVFVHLSHSLHFTKTSKVMHMSPSTLSRIIQRLELELNQTLFERDNRSVKLTDAGIKLLEFSNSVLLQKQSLKAQLEQERETISGSLTLFCTVTAAHVYAPKLIETFRKQYPDADIKLETGDVALAFEKIEQQTVDFAYAVLPNKLSSKYHFHSIASIPFKLIGPTIATPFSDHMSATEINWEQLPFIMPESGPVRERMLAWFKLMNIKPNVYAQVSGHEAIVSMTALGCGVSAIPYPVLEHSPLIDKVKILPVSIPPMPLNLGICCLNKRLKIPVNAAFWSLLIDVYQT